MRPSKITCPEALERHTLPYLACLLGCTASEAWHWPLTFQSFADDKVTIERLPGLTRELHGTLAQLAPDLERLNSAGAGIFVTVNGTDGKGRRKVNIRVHRAWWADLDTKDALSPFDPACGPLEATMLVRTPGGWHQYFLAHEPAVFLDDPARAEFEHDLKRIQATMARFGADPKVCDVGRVLRLPGFLHRKADPRMVELVKVDGPRYTLRQVRAAFPPLKPVSKPVGAPRGAAHAQGRPENWRDRVAAFLAACEPSIQGSNGSRALFTTCMKLFTRFGLAVDEVVEQVMAHYNVAGRCTPVWTLVEVQHKAESANLAAGASRGGAWVEGRRHE